ncbi:MAG: hypothetical protein FWH28_07810 [Clostridiales bacterium]|nr:hypothetical protein [Clostridiales bacterium]
MEENGENQEYTVKDLLEQALHDESWEPDAEKREQLVQALERSLNYL